MRKFILFSPIPLAALILYYPVIFTYFSQDDFFHFKISLTDGSISQFLNLFGFHPFSERGIAFYRPIFREFLFNSFYWVFGLNPIPFRILQFSLLFLNSALAYYLIKIIFRNNFLPFFVAFFYAISAAQVSPLYYLAGGIQVLGATTFLLLTIIFSFKRQAISIAAFIFFLLALGSHELASVIPVLLLGLYFAGNSFKKALRKIPQTLPYFIVLSIYVYLEVIIIGFSKSEQQYQTVLSLKTILNSYMWYFGWAFGLPEMLIDFVLPGFKLNPALMRYWGNYYLIIFSTFFISLFLIITGFTYFIIQNKKMLFNKFFLFFIFWFIISLIPVIFLPSHKSAQYLATGLVAFWTVIGFIVLNIYESFKYPKIFIGIILCSLFTLSATSAILQRSTYWAAERGKYAKQLIEQVTTTYPILPKGAVLYFKNDPDYPFIAKEWGSSSKQAAFILNNEDALQLVYHDPLLKVYFEDSGKILPEFPKERAFTVTAKIF